MNQDGFSYIVRAELVFTPEEVEILKRCSQAHYDFKCNSASQQGGLIYGLINVFALEEPEPEPRALDSQDLNLLLKVCEMAPTLGLAEGVGLRMRLKVVFDRVQEQQRWLQQTEPERHTFFGPIEL